MADFFEGGAESETGEGGPFLFEGGRVAVVWGTQTNRTSRLSTGFTKQTGNRRTEWEEREMR